jgi:alpha-glucosidase
VCAALPDGAYANWVFGNHDQPRIASRIGRAQARVAMMLLLTLRGAPTLYYGEEIGMENVNVPPDRIRDPWGIAEPAQGRDPERSPMQWDASPNAGFSAPDVEPWLPLASDAETVNVAAQRDDPASMLTLTRRLLALRKEHPLLRDGDFESVGPTTDGTFAFRRVTHDGRLVVALNLTDEPRVIDDAPHGRVVIGTHPDREGAPVRGTLELRANEAVVVESD